MRNHRHHAAEIGVGLVKIELMLDPVYSTLVSQKQKAKKQSPDN